jgi:hypothetical protein
MPRLVADHRMQQRFQRLLRRRVREHQAAHLGAVKRAAVPDQRGAEDALDLRQRAPAARRKLVRDRVGVDHVRAQTLELRCRRALAAADAAGQTDDEAHPANLSTG